MIKIVQNVYRLDWSALLKLILHEVNEPRVIRHVKHCQSLKLITFQGLQPICNSFVLVALSWTVLIASSTNLEGMTVKRDTGVSPRDCICDQLLLTTFLVDYDAIASQTLDGLDVSFKCLLQQIILYTHLSLHLFKTPALFGCVFCSAIKDAFTSQILAPYL